MNSSTRALGPIVVGTDFTPCSATALAQAIRIAEWSGAALNVIHVIDTAVVLELEEALSPMRQDIRESLIEDAKRACVEFLKTVPAARKLPPLDINVSINNRIAGILHEVHGKKANLLVLGASGSDAPNVGLGTVATACVRKSMSDVLLIRDSLPQGESTRFTTIVAAVDFSPTSLRAVEQAAMFAAQDGAQMHLLHVFQPPWERLLYRAPTPLAPPHLQKQYRDGLERRLAEFCRPAIEKHASLRTQFTVGENPGHRSGIIEYAGKVAADLIVLGTRGCTNLRDILLGSTAEKALAASECSILAVKPEGFHHPLATGQKPRTM